MGFNIFLSNYVVTRVRTRGERWIMLNSSNQSGQTIATIKNTQQNPADLLFTPLPNRNLSEMAKQNRKKNRNKTE